MLQRCGTQMLHYSHVRIAMRSYGCYLQAENALLAQQVEELTSQQASGHHQSAERDEDVKALQQQLALMRQQMDSSNSALEALEAASQDQATQAECKVGGLETDLENVRTEKLLADQATQQAVKKLSEVPCS